MKDSEWGSIAALIATAWPTSRWPLETQDLYRAKLDGCKPEQLAAVVDKLIETQEFLPAVSVILKEFQRRNPVKQGLNGSGHTYGTLEYFENIYGPEQGKVERAEWVKWRSSQAARLEDRRSGERGPRLINPGSEIQP